MYDDFEEVHPDDVESLQDALNKLYPSGSDLEHDTILDIPSQLCVTIMGSTFLAWCLGTHSKLPRMILFAAYLVAYTIKVIYDIEKREAVYIARQSDGSSEVFAIRPGHTLWGHLPSKRDFTLLSLDADYKEVAPETNRTSNEGPEQRSPDQEAAPHDHHSRPQGNDQPPPPPSPPRMPPRAHRQSPSRQDSQRDDQRDAPEAEERESQKKGQKALWAMPCFRVGVGYEVDQINVTSFESDFQLFQALQANFFAKRSWWRRAFDLVDVTNVTCVQVGHEACI